MRKMCTTLAGIILVFGIICSIILAWNNGVVEDYDSYHGIEEKRSFLLTVMWFVCGIFVTVVADGEGNVLIDHLSLAQLVQLSKML